MKTAAVLFLVLGVPGLVPGPALAGALSDLDVGDLRERPLTLRWGPDPFVPKVRLDLPVPLSGSPERGGAVFTLTAVVLGGGAPAALIDGALVHQGETVRGYRLVEIQRDRVFLQGPKGRIDLSLSPLFSTPHVLP